MNQSTHTGPKTLAQIVTLPAESCPNRTAIVYGDKSLSFADLNIRSNQVANGLAALGVPARSRVAILTRNSEIFFEALFGAAKADTVLVTVNFRLAAREIAYILGDSETRVLFVSAEYLPLVREVRDELPELQEVIVTDGNDDAYGTWLRQQPSSSPGIEIDPADGAVQMYTSGTTGNPKGVELSHRAMVNAALAGLTVWPFMHEEGASVLGTMPLFHIAAANLCIAALCAGATARIVRDATPEQLADIIPRHRISIAPLPATVIHNMLRLPGIRDRDFSALRVMLVAGSGIAPELVREAGEVFRCGFALSYGSTETCGGVTYLHPEECTPDSGNLLKSAGRTLWESAVRIVDADGNDQPAGTVGEILCRCNRLMTGYWRNEDATADALRDGWFWSGDAGYLDEDGYLYVVDRIKDMVISGGENIYPTEVEAVLQTHESVEDVAVVGIPDEKWGEALLAFVVPKAEREINGEALLQFLRGKLAGYKIPRRYEFVDEFPRNATGKVLKRELRKPYWESQDRNVG